MEQKWIVIKNFERLKKDYILDFDFEGYDEWHNFGDNVDIIKKNDQEYINKTKKHKTFAYKLFTYKGVLNIDAMIKYNVFIMV